MEEKNLSITKNLQKNNGMQDSVIEQSNLLNLYNIKLYTNTDIDMNFFYKKESTVKSPEKKFPKENLDTAINLLAYGVNVQKLYNGSFYHSCIFYIYETNIRYLQWLSSKKHFFDSRLDLLKIRLIYDNKSFDLKKNKEKNESLLISYWNNKEKKKILNLRFTTFQQKNLFWQGLLFFMKEAKLSYENRTNIDQLASNYFQISTQEKEMSFMDLKKFLKNRQIFVEETELKDILNKLNYQVDKNFKLNKNMIKALLKEMLHCNEFVEIFSNYCESWLEHTVGHEYYMKLEELKKFFLIEQKQILEDNVIKNMIYAFEDKQNTAKNKNDKISLNGFRNILFSMNNQIFDNNKMEFYQDMTRPLTDYYIKSSHNTYLKSNQIVGKSSVEAYIQALAKGYRCIELDCWDGDKGDPIIYHGHTLTTKINLDSVLQAIVDFGFIKNPFPIILSIENHCCKSQQQRMYELIKDICGKSLYSLPENHEKYQFFPSPQDLLYKILIKTKIPFISTANSDSYIENELSASLHKVSLKIKSSQIIRISNNNEIEKSLFKPKDNTCLRESLNDFAEEDVIKTTNFNNAENMGLLGANPHNLIQVKSISNLKQKLIEEKKLKKNENLKEKYEEPKQEEDILEKMRNKSLLSKSGICESIQNSSQILEDFTQKNIKNFMISKTRSENIIKKIEPIEFNNSNKLLVSNKNSNCIYDYSPDVTSSNVDIILKKKHKKSKFKTSVDSYFTQNLSIDFSKINENFKKCICLIGMKLNLKSLDNRSVFTICSLNEFKINKRFNENEKNIIDFHRKYLSRIYPSGARIDSSNYDPVTAILSGSQMTAMNMQTNDISLLLYNSIFQENGGVNSGYVLKPHFLRSDIEPTHRIYPYMMQKVKQTLRIKILSGQKISGNNKNSIQNIFLEVLLRGHRLDEMENKIYKSEIIKKNSLYVVFNMVVEFEIRCPDICFIIFQLFARNDLMCNERMAWYCIPFNCIRQGYRIIPLLNNSLIPIENKLLFAYVQINKL